MRYTSGIETVIKIIKYRLNKTYYFNAQCLYFTKKIPQNWYRKVLIFILIKNCSL